MNNKSNLLNHNGFTLVELAGILVVMGILLAIAVPSISSFMRSARLAGSSNELVGDIEFTRSLATSTRRTYHIEFEDTQYKIVETATNRTVRTSSLPAGISCSATANPSFYPWGLVDPVTITLEGGSRQLDLGLSANGRVCNE
jgi:Tfp pilus assembly protein FimT